jgi:trehalose-phosphatase
MKANRFSPGDDPSSAGDALELARPMLDRRPMLIVSDFDGTLAQLNLDPWAARILPLARRSLRRLAAVPGVHVAFLSGRTAIDLAARARVGGATYLGNHGAEHGHLARGDRAERLTVAVASAPESITATALRLADEVPRLVPEEWLVVERKIPSVAFHFRGAPDVPAAATRVRAAVERIDPEQSLVRFQGRRVLELRPADAPTKGHAMRSLLDRVGPAVVFVLGDGRDDALAFDEVRTARANGECDGLAIAVAAHADTVPDVAPSADVVLANQVEVARFLAGLARRARGRSEATPLPAAPSPRPASSRGPHRSPPAAARSRSSPRPRPPARHG